MAKDKFLRVKRFDTDEEVHKVKVSNPNQRKVEKIMMGMLRNMGDDFYIHDSEFDDLDMKLIRLLLRDQSDIRSFQSQSNAFWIRAAVVTRMLV